MEKRIIIVDDEVQILQILKEAFESKGYIVTCAASGEEAMDILEREEFNIYIFDINLPGISGLELCKRTKKMRPSGFYFAMTGFVSLYDLVKCRKVGFDDYFPKPFSINALLKVTAEAFEKIARWNED